MTTPTHTTYPPAPLSTSTSTLPHQLHANNKPRPIPPPPTTMMSPSTSPLPPAAPPPPPPPSVVTTPWSYAPVSTVTAPPTRVYTTVRSQSAGPPPPPAPPPPITMHHAAPPPPPQIQHHHHTHHPHTHPHHHYTQTIYAAHGHPHHVTHHPTTATGTITHAHHAMSTAEYMHNGSPTRVQSVATTAGPVQSGSSPSSAASTAYCQQRIRQLEEELAGAKREIERLMSRLSEVEKDRTSVKESGNTMTPPTKTQTRYWTQDEHMRFLEALGKYGPKDVRSIAAYVGSRNATQVRTHAQKYFLRVQRQAAQRAGGGAGSVRKRSMSESDLTKMGARAKTPPDSPRVDEVGRELGPVAAGVGVGVVGGRISKRVGQGCVGSMGRKMGSPTSSSGGKPPVVGGSTGGVNAGNMVGGGVPANCGINLLSIVASERKDAMIRGAGGLPPKVGGEVGGNRGNENRDTEMRESR